MKARDIICYTIMTIIIIVLNVRAWNMTRTDSFLDPLNWGGLAVVVIICGLMMWLDKKDSL